MSGDKKSERLWILDPTVSPGPAPAAMAVRPESLDGRTVCLLDNGKPNADRVLDLVAQELANRHSLAGIVKMRKPDSTRPAPGRMLDDIAEQCQVAIVGVGD